MNQLPEDSETTGSIPGSPAETTESVALPVDGDVIRARNRAGEVFSGVVDLVWLAIDTPCIDVKTIDGLRYVFPELGDRWELT